MSIAAEHAASGRHSMERSPSWGRLTIETRHPDFATSFIRWTGPQTAR